MDPENYLPDHEINKTSTHISDQLLTELLQAFGSMKADLLEFNARLSAQGATVSQLESGFLTFRAQQSNRAVIEDIQKDVKNKVSYQEFIQFKQETNENIRAIAEGRITKPKQGNKQTKLEELFRENPGYRFHEAIISSVQLFMGTGDGAKCLFETSSSGKFWVPDDGRIRRNVTYSETFAGMEFRITEAVVLKKEIIRANTEP